MKELIYSKNNLVIAIYAVVLITMDFYFKTGSGVWNDNSIVAVWCRDVSLTILI